MPTATLCPTQHWKSFIKITRKPWESSFRSSLTTLPVGGNHNSKQWDGQRWKRDENPARERFHRDFIITWQVRQTLATYPSKSPASILSSTSAQMRLTTRRSTQRQQVCLHASAGSASALVFYSWKWIASDVPSHQLVFRSLGKSSFIFIYLTTPPPPRSPHPASAVLFLPRQERKRPSCSPWGQPKPWRWQLWMWCAALLCCSESKRTSGWPSWKRARRAGSSDATLAPPQKRQHL